MTETIKAAESLAHSCKCSIDIQDVAPAYVPEGYTRLEDRAFKKFNESTVVLHLLLF